MTLLKNVEPITSEELKDLDLRLVLSRTDPIQWRTVSMAEYAKIRAYIHKLEKDQESELRSQLLERESRVDQALDFFSQFFDHADQIIMSLKDELSSIRLELERIQISEGYDFGRDHYYR